MNIGAQWPTPAAAEATVLRTQTKLHRWAGKRPPVDRLRSWRAGCSGTGTSGSEGGLRKRTDRKAGTGAQLDPTRPHTARSPSRENSDRGPRHIGQLLLEARIVGELEGLHQMRLQPVSGPDPLHGIGIHTLCLGDGGQERFIRLAEFQRGTGDRIQLGCRNHQPFVGRTQRPLPIGSQIPASGLATWKASVSSR